MLFKKWDDIMGLWNHLRGIMVKQWCQEVRDYAQGVGEMQRKYKKPVGME